MSVPHKCPKCNGVGWLQYDPKMPFAGSTTSTGPWKCDVCNNGIIWEITTNEQLPTPPR